MDGGTALTSASFSWKREGRRERRHLRRRRHGQLRHHVHRQHLQRRRACRDPQLPDHRHLGRQRRLPRLQLLDVRGREAEAQAGGEDGHPRQAEVPHHGLTGAAPFYQLPLQRPPFLADVQCRVHGVWTDFPGEVGVAGSDGKASWMYGYYGVKPGTYLVRACLRGTSYNIAGRSAVQRIVVR